MEKEVEREQIPGMLDLSLRMNDEDEIFSTKADLTLNAITVLEKRYLRRDLSGEVIEEPEDMFARVAKTMAEVDLNYNPNASVKTSAHKFYNMMVKREFMPNSPTLMNAGRYLGQLSACFVLPVEDSMKGIFDTLKNTALIHKSGGGTGFSFSRIRPANDIVHSTVGISSGPISFMKVYDAATETVKQGGTRRGANMGILRVDHPDIEDFITCKADLDELNNFNISVAVTEDFMKAVEDDALYDLKNPRTGEVVERKRARKVFDSILHQAWGTGEPGIVFIDRINKDNPTPHIEEIESTNPCGEQPLLPYESCNLGSINLAVCIKDGAINYDQLKRVVQDSVHFLDNVIDANRYPIDKIAEKTLSNRKVGLGVMGFADMLFQLGVPYNSDKAMIIAEDVMSFIQTEGRKASEKLAAQRGVFPNFKGSIYDNTDSPRVRNATVTTIAPTGTISIISGTSSGIEPVFALAYERHVMDDTKLVEVNPYFKKALKDAGLYSEELMKNIVDEGTIQHIDEIPQDLKEIFVTAHDITPEWHIKIQSAFQKYTDNAVSKTVNFSNDATEDDVRDVYMLAYNLGCKGVTIYRDGSRKEQVLRLSKKEEGEQEIQNVPVMEKKVIRERAAVTRGMTFKVAAGCGNLYVTINEDDRGMCELFTQLGKSGGCTQSWSEGMARLISLGLRSGIDPEEIVDQLKGIACPSPVWDRGEMIKSCPDAISKALKWYMEARKSGQDENLEQERKKTNQILNDHIEKTSRFELADSSQSDKEMEMGVICPECGARLYYEEGCQKCHSCGYSKCG